VKGSPLFGAWDTGCIGDGQPGRNACNRIQMGVEGLGYIYKELLDLVGILHLRTAFFDGKYLASTIDGTPGVGRSQERSYGFPVHLFRLISLRGKYVIAPAKDCVRLCARPDELVRLAYPADPLAHAR
jgi:hypothetical protein